jgi:hypothetical protein
MNSERLVSLRRLTEHCAYHDDGNDMVACTCAEPLDARPLITELIGYVDELTRQRDDAVRERNSARDLAVKSGIFQDHHAEVYPQSHDEQPSVGPVAWDRQEQQR